MGGLPFAMTVEPMKLASNVAFFRDFDGYCSRQWNFAMALETTFIFERYGFTLAPDHHLSLPGWGA